MRASLVENLDVPKPRHLSQSLFAANRVQVNTTMDFLISTTVSLFNDIF